jgi:hypothetical protein
MGFFSKKKNISYALINIDSASIGGGLAYIPEGATPILYFTERRNIEPKEHEDVVEAMIRTVEEVTDSLMKKGAPALRKETGNGHVDKILVSIGAPWQKTSIRIETISEKKPFSFTKALLADTIRNVVEIPKGFRKSGESVLATLLNGYNTPNPFGMKVSRAEMIILSSLVDSDVADKVENVLRKTYHTHALTITAFAPLAYSVFKNIYPHETDFLVLQISGEATDIAFVKHGLLVNVASITHGVNDLMRNLDMAAKVADNETHESVNLLDSSRNERFSKNADEAKKTWLLNIIETLRGFSTSYALPHTLFLLADAEVRDYLKNALDSQTVRVLWLTDDPLRVIATTPSHFTNFVKTRGDAEVDIHLEMLALFSKEPGSK